MRIVRVHGSGHTGKLCGPVADAFVGHRHGGTIIGKFVEMVPDRVRRLVDWNASVLADGASLDDDVPPHDRALVPRMAAANPDRSVMLPFPIRREAFIDDADLATAGRAYEQMSPEP